MDRLHGLTKYFLEKERKKLDEASKDSKTGLPEMSVRNSYYISTKVKMSFLVLARRDSIILS
jgi:hypothetical protein